MDEALEMMSPAFEGLYSRIGRPSIPPEKPLRALPLQAFYSVRLERQLMEQLDYNLLFRWFVGLSIDAPVWDVTVFTKNRERLLAGDVAEAARFSAACLERDRMIGLRFTELVNPCVYRLREQIGQMDASRLIGTADFTLALEEPFTHGTLIK